MSRAKVGDAAYRRGVGIMLFNRSGLIFVAQRIDTDADAWQMPQGGIDEGEAPADAARRELKEEIGTDRAEIVAESKDWHRYELPADLQPLVWGGKFRGQMQKWFAMRFTGTDKDIDLETEHPEFSAWKWAKAATLPDLIVPFKRALYRDIVAEFKNVLPK
jgi:putative (di)nucleoside polyphosphate hydrolase